MRKIRNVIKGGLCYGLAVAFLLSGTACGKDEIVVDDYYGDSDTVTESGSDSGTGDSIDDETDGDADDTSNASQSGSGYKKSDGQSLTDFFGGIISESGVFSIGSANVKFKLNYTVPDVSMVNVYEGRFINDDDDSEKQIVGNFFGGTEKKLDEIRRVNDTDFIPLLYKYGDLLMSLASEAPTGNANFVDFDFEEVYTWVDEDTYYIHMYEGEYNGTRYGMIYAYDKDDSIRDIFISPISIAEYFPELEAKSLFVVDPQSKFESDNLCSKSEESINIDATDVLEKLGLNRENIQLSFNPNMAIPKMGIIGSFYEEDYSKMPKLVFADTDFMSAVQKINTLNPAGKTYDYNMLTVSEAGQSRQSASDDVTFTENGYAVYLCAAPFSENVEPQAESTFNRGSLYFTDKGLYSADIMLTAEMDNEVEDVQLLSFDNIKESFKVALENDAEIKEKASDSLEVNDLAFTYVLVEDKENLDKATYVPAWIFTTTDKKKKSGEEHVVYTHIINAIDGSCLNDTTR